jgi:hypothetical protein
VIERMQRVHHLCTCKQRANKSFKQFQKLVMKIKARVWIVALVLLVTQTDSFSQYATYNGKRPILVDEDAIRHITVSGNVDVVLRQNSKPGTIVKVEEKSTGNLKASVADRDLFIESDPNSTERVVVYVWTDDLYTLTLKDNSYAVSIGILDFRDLRVNILDKARVALRAADKIRFNAPSDRQLVSNEKYFSVMSTDK